MTLLIASAAFFVLLHLLVSGTALRGVLVGKMGEGRYLGLFSTASMAGLAWLIFAYVVARQTPASELWSLGPASRHVQVWLQLAAMLLIVGGLATPNPGAVRQEGALDRPDVVKGMLRITRHPFLWGMALWAGGHLLVNSDPASLVMFGGFVVLSLMGTRSIDAKRARALGDKWAGFAAQTSNIPFAAVLAGRQRLALGEIGWRVPAIAAAIWAAATFGHVYVIGTSALP
jgi:uncharacterized membrane protein